MYFYIYVIEFACCFLVVSTGAQVCVGFLSGTWEWRPQRDLFTCHEKWSHWFAGIWMTHQVHFGGFTPSFPLCTSLDRILSVSPPVSQSVSQPVRQWNKRLAFPTSCKLSKKVVLTDLAVSHVEWFLLFLLFWMFFSSVWYCDQRCSSPNCLLSWPASLGSPI